MEKIRLGTSNLSVTRFCLGTMTWGEQNTQAEAFEQMDYALDVGLTFWDTAELYAVPPKEETYGATETMIGNWFAANPGKRDELVLASKVSGAFRAYIRNGDPISPKGMREALEGSLRRLKTDRIDLYQLHWPNRPYPHHQMHWGFKPNANFTREREEMAAIMREIGAMIAEGKILAWGLSNDTPWGVMTYCRLADELGIARPASVQNEYSLLYRMDDAYMEEVLVAEQVGYLPYSSLGGGFMTGKYSGGTIPAGTRLAVMGGRDGRINPRSLAAADAYVDLAKQHNLTPAQLALAWTLTRPMVTSTIIGATSMAQLKDDMSALDVKLSKDVLAGIEALRREWQMSW